MDLNVALTFRSARADLKVGATSTCRAQQATEKLIGDAVLDPRRGLRGTWPVRFSAASKAPPFHPLTNKVANFCN
jgi:hypothetical protein